MNLPLTLLAFFVAISVLIVVHELGHYWVARWCGVKVLRFSLGMGKVVCSRKVGPDQTEWTLSALPLGGYVKLLDARSPDIGELSPEEQKREFTQQKVWRRIAIVAAGPFSNFLLAVLILAGLYVYGTPEPSTTLRAVPEATAAYQAGFRGGELITAVNGSQVRSWTDLRWKVMEAVIGKVPVRLDAQRPTDDSSRNLVVSYVLPGKLISAEELEKNFMGKLGLSPARPPATISKVIPDGPAMKAGLLEGDLLMEVNGLPVLDGLAFVEMVRAAPSKELKISGLRNQKVFNVVVTPETQLENGLAVGKIKAEIPSMPEMIISRDALPTAIVKGVAKTWDTSIVTVKMIGKMIVGEVSIKNITGPITIADYAGQTARAGLIHYFQFIAFISISIGVMNLLPIPVLDGGLLLYYAVEMLTGRTVSGRFGEIAQRVGVAILMTLLVVAVFNDIVRLLS